jgi:hypothetical protein
MRSGGRRTSSHHPAGDRRIALGNPLHDRRFLNLLVTRTPLRRLGAGIVAAGANTAA